MPLAATQRHCRRLRQSPCRLLPPVLAEHLGLRVLRHWQPYLPRAAHSPPRSESQALQPCPALCALGERHSQAARQTTTCIIEPISGHYSSMKAAPQHGDRSAPGHSIVPIPAAPPPGYGCTAWICLGNITGQARPGYHLRGHLFTPAGQTSLVGSAFSIAGLILARSLPSLPTIKTPQAGSGCAV